jgi:hypothetical protein
MTAVSDGIMERIASLSQALFPKPKAEILKTMQGE